MVSADPLEEPSLPLEMLDPSRFWRGIDAGLADRWSTGLESSLFLLPEGQQHPDGLVLLRLLRRVPLVGRYEVSHSEAQLQPHRLRRREFGQSTD